VIDSITIRNSNTREISIKLADDLFRQGESHSPAPVGEYSKEFVSRLRITDYR